jgi:type II secretory pathway predicted ATPase ExeA
MYTSFFGFNESPFSLTPDPRYLFLSPHHKEALDHLLYGINERKGFITITGGIGTGKTTLCRALLGHLNGTTKSALILNAFISDMELLKAINEEFGVDGTPEAQSKKDYIDALNHFLIQNFSAGGNAVILLDEAQNLSHNVLEQIRMLSNLETEREKLLQIVLVGQSELKDVLAAPALRQLDERIMVRYDLRPLDYKDVEGYVNHRLTVAGGKGQLKFAESAFKKIYAYSRGNPRRINAVCDRALLIAYAREKNTVTKGMIASAVEELRGSRSTTDPRRAEWSWGNFLSFTLLLLLLILVAGFAGWSSRERISEFFGVEQREAYVAQTFKARMPLPEPPKQEVPKEAPLFLDGSQSLAGLFDLFSKGAEKNEPGIPEDVTLSVVSFRVDPEYHVVFRKPFRIALVGLEQEGPQYLLLREVTRDGAIAVDGDGKDRYVSRELILKHWGWDVSCIYPIESRRLYLRKGKQSPEVQMVQRVLVQRGYLTEETGTYDDNTFQAVRRFQMDFDLKADGIVGHQTMSLLYQMME